MQIKTFQNLDFENGFYMDLDGPVWIAVYMRNNRSLIRDKGFPISSRGA